MKYINSIKVTIKDRNALQLIAMERISEYLFEKDWSLETRIDENELELGSRWTKTKGNNTYSIFVPTKHDKRDYASRVSEILLELEKVEDRSQLDIWAELAGYEIRIVNKNLLKLLK